MTTLEFVAHRKYLKCEYQRPKVKVTRHAELGRILSKEVQERAQMQIDKPELVLPQPEDMDYIF